MRLTNAGPRGKGLSPAARAAAGLQDLMRVLTEYEEGGGPKQDILEADDEEGEEMEVDGSGVGSAGEGAGASESECGEALMCPASHASRCRPQGGRSCPVSPHTHDPWVRGVCVQRVCCSVYCSGWVASRARN